VIVSGEGEATLTPDMAILTMAVTREAETAADALSANNEAMAAVLADLKQAGVAERDVQTSGFSISPRYRQDPSTDGGYEAPEIAGYQVSNTVTVRVRDLSALGGLIDRSVKLGVNDGGNIALTNDDPDAAIAEARAEAVADAAAKAKAAKDADARLAKADAEISAKIAAADVELAKATAKALSGIETVAAEAAADIVAKVSGAKVTSAQAAKAVKAVMSHG
jgi:uncharacterized protein YggE